MSINTKWFKIILICFLSIGVCYSYANAENSRNMEKKIRELEEKISILSAELQDLKKAQRESKAGISAVGDKINFHGYGELHYNNTSQEGSSDEIDFHRFVLGLTIPFSDRIIFDSEIDYEHATSELELEYATLDFLLSDAINLRMGSMLMPVGYLNEYHEPTRFYSVERPYVQKYVIPTTWQEGGVGIYGSPIPEIDYRLYVVGGLDASSFEADSGIRKGRGKVAEQKAEDLATVARLEYSPFLGLDLGFSGYLGDAAQGDSSLGDATVGILEADARYNLRGLELTGLISDITVDDTEQIFSSSGQVIGEEILGWYLEAAYHWENLLFSSEEDEEGKTETNKQDLVTFLRHEQFDTHEEVASSLTADPANDREVTTLGLAYYPVENVVLKADLENWEDGTSANWHQFNLGFGYEF